MVKQKISDKERARRRRQAKINFGHSKKSKGKSRKVRTMARKKSYRRSKKGTGDLKPLIAGGLYAVIGEPILDMVAAKVGVGVSDDVVKGIASYFAFKKGRGQVREMGKAGMYIAANTLAKAKLGSLNLFGNNGGAAAGDGW